MAKDLYLMYKFTLVERDLKGLDVCISCEYVEISPLREQRMTYSIRVYPLGFRQLGFRIFD